MGRILTTDRTEDTDKTGWDGSSTTDRVDEQVKGSAAGRPSGWNETV